MPTCWSRSSTRPTGFYEQMGFSRSFLKSPILCYMFLHLLTGLRYIIIKLSKLPNLGLKTGTFKGIPRKRHLVATLQITISIVHWGT